MSNIKNIDKNDCLKIIKKNDKYSIHPLLNTYYNYSKYQIFENKPDMCHVLPQLIKKDIGIKTGSNFITNIGTNILKSNLESSDSKLNINLDIFENNNIDTSTDFISSTNSTFLKNDNNYEFKYIDPVLNFTLAINKNNFLDIVFHITSLEDLNNWLFTNNINKLPIKMINTILDLFWENYYDKIDEDIYLFIEMNKKLIKIYYQKDLTIEITKLIVNKLIKDNYGKKINYLSKIKKYLTKYI
jgi:hypothetical protein